MKVEILINKDMEKPLWLVNTDIVSIPFSREPDALTFANRLNARLNAAHVWPGDTPAISAFSTYPQPKR